MTTETTQDPATMVDDRLAAYAPELVSDELRQHLLAVAQNADAIAQWATAQVDTGRTLDQAIDEATRAPGEVAIAVVSGALVDAEAVARILARLEATAPQLAPGILTDAQQRIVRATAQAQSDLGRLHQPAYLRLLDAVYAGKADAIPVRLPTDVEAEEGYRRTRADVMAWIEDNDRLAGELTRMSLEGSLATATGLLAKAAELRATVEHANTTTAAADAERVAQGL